MESKAKRRKRAEVVVVTGASAGVGRAVVREFARRGAWIGLLARGEDGLEGARREVEALGGRALVLPTDVSNAAQVNAAADAVEREFGPIDVWVNNAMVSLLSPAKEIQPEEFRRVTEVSYLGYVHGTVAALNRMLPRNRGAIVQVGSAQAFRALPLQSAYAGAQHAIRGFTSAVRMEVKHDRSRVRIIEVLLPAVNTPHFGWVKSKLARRAQPIGPIFQPELAARAIYWAAHQNRRQVLVGRSTSLAASGTRWMPGIAGRLAARKAYKSQHEAPPKAPGRLNNLWDPLPGDHGAHGPFGRKARSYSAQFWLSRHRVAVSIALGALATAGGLLAVRAAQPEWSVDQEGLGYEAMIPDESYSRGKIDSLARDLSRRLKGSR